MTARPVSCRRLVRRNGGVAWKVAATRNTITPEGAGRAAVFTQGVRCGIVHDAYAPCAFVMPGRCRSRHFMLLLGTGVVLAAGGARGAGAQAAPNQGEELLCMRDPGLATGLHVRKPQGPTLSIGVHKRAGVLGSAFALANAGAAGAGASLGYIMGMISCTRLGDIPLLGVSARTSVIRAYGSPGGSVQPGQTYLGAEITMHFAFALGVGSYYRVAGPAREKQLFTISFGLGF